MPEHRPAPDAPKRAALATIQRIKAEITSHPDPELLNEIRAAFRREIPLHLRSYAAALLILESSGGARPGRRNEGRQSDGRQADGRRGKGRQGDERGKRGPPARWPEKRRQERPQAGQASGRPPQGRQGEGSAERSEMPSEDTRPRFKGEATTVFFGMGKRQRLYPRVLLRILTEEGGLSFEEIGDIRSFDNYSFADLDPLCAEGLIAGLDGKPFRGRGLPVSKARKRGEAVRQEKAPPKPGADPPLRRRRPWLLHRFRSGRRRRLWRRLRPRRWIRRL